MRRELVAVAAALVCAAALGADFRQQQLSISFEPNAGFRARSKSVDLLGAANDGRGNLAPVPPDALGITTYSDSIGGASGPNARSADFNGDGWPDVVILPYASTNSNLPAQLYVSDHEGNLSPSPTFNGSAYQGRGETIVIADFNNDGTLDIFFPMYTYLSCHYDLAVQPGATNPYCNSSKPYQAGTCGPQDPASTWVYNALQSFLLLNDGAANFQEAAVAAGVSMHSAASGILPASTDPCGNQPEAAQAADFNMDGLIDLYVGGHLFINQGIDANNIPHFKDMAQSLGLTWHIYEGLVADEGAKFLDWNNDGRLDLVIHNWYAGPAYGPTLFEFNGTSFVQRGFNASKATEGAALTSPTMTCATPPKSGTNFFSSRESQENGAASFGINVYDFNNDGLEDIVTAADANEPPILYQNTGCGFTDVTPQSAAHARNSSSPAFADFNHDGLVDFFINASTDGGVYTNTTSVPANSSFTIEVLGPNGESNQQGRVVQIFPAGSQQVFTRVVDGGSGYHNVNQYPLLVGTPFSGTHTVKVYYAPLQKCVYQGSPCSAAVVTFAISPGEYAKVYAPSPAKPHGQTMIVPNPATLIPIFAPALSR